MTKIVLFERANVDAGDGTFDGSPADDLLLGTAENDRLRGYGGDDLLYAFEGDDKLFGGGGSDSLLGEDGDDILDGGLGDDFLYGGFGADLYLFGMDSGRDEIHGNGGVGDQVRLAEGITVDDVTLTRIRSYHFEGEFDLTLQIKDTDDQLTIINQFSPYYEEGIESIVFADGTVWDEAEMLARIISSEDDNYVLGTSGNDNLDGLGGDDQILGDGGDDFIAGGDGNDEVFGGEGNDILRGGSGNDGLYGSSGDDNVQGGVGRDYLRGNSGDDKLNGGGAGDYLDGGSGNDKLYGGIGNDVLMNGGGGMDWLSGGSGEDNFYFVVSPDELQNIATVADFNIAHDSISLSRGAFTQFKQAYPDSIPANFFVASETGDAVDADDYILYETDTGKLFYDRDGNGAGAKVQFGQIGVNTHAALTADDFTVI